MPDTRVRLFSDLHYRDPASTLQDLDALAPLFRDAGRVVFNGDTFDTQIPSLRAHVPEGRAFLARAAPDAIFLTGNHDPDLTDLAELSLCDDRVWITHGDVFFDAIAPWSHHHLEIRGRLAALATGLTAEEGARVETSLRLNRLACQKLPEPPDLFNPTPWSRARRLGRTLFPPTRFVSMARSWYEAPRIVAALARSQRPRARVVVLGHIHYPGVWHVPGEPGVTVINTGSFTRPFGGLFVDLKGERVRVVRIVKVGGEFRPGRVVADFPLGRPA